MEALQSRLSAWAPQVLSVLRIVAGLLFLHVGLVKILGFPFAWATPIPMFGMIWFAGMIELITGVLLVLGLFTLPAAFIASGEMAFAYFIGHHIPRGFFPVQNGGSAAILYCFVFLYIVFAGPGPWSLDAMRAKKG